MRNRRRRASPQREEDKNSAQLLSLSLFIMMLAFFIVLNALSSFEDTRVKPIMESIENSFTSRLEQKDDLLPSMTQSNEYSIYEGDMLERIEALFRSVVPGSKIVRNDAKGVMHIRLQWGPFRKAILQIDDPAGAKQDIVIKDNSESDSSAGVSFLPVLVSLMRLEKAGLVYRMDMVLNVRDNPAHIQTQNPQAFLGYVRQTSDVAARLERAGFPVRLMTIGLEKGAPGMVDIFFAPHVPFNPLGHEATDGAEE